MEAGESLNWIVPGEDGDVIGASVTYTMGDGTWACQGLEGISSLDATSIVTQQIVLNSGWNIWSTYVDPEDANMGATTELEPKSQMHFSKV